MSFNALSLLNLINPEIVIAAVNRLSEEQGSPGRTGGVIAIAVINKTKPELSSFASAAIGAPGLKVTSYGKNVSEKIWRLYTRRAEGKDEFAASQSADPGHTTHPTYGGCIVFKLCLPDKGEDDLDIYISFSGAPPDVDEVIVYVLGESMGFVNMISGYPLYERAHELLKGAVINMP